MRVIVVPLVSEYSRSGIAVVVDAVSSIIIWHDSVISVLYLFIYIYFFLPFLLSYDRLSSSQLHMMGRSGFSYDYLCDVNRVLHSWARRALSKKFDAYCGYRDNRRQDVLLCELHENATDLRKSTISWAAFVFRYYLDNLLKLNNLVPAGNVYELTFFESRLPSTYINRATISDRSWLYYCYNSRLLFIRNMIKFVYIYNTI